MADVLTPQYRVIAPTMGYDFRVGDLVRAQRVEVRLAGGDHVAIRYEDPYKNYPANFKPAEWWINRTLEEFDSIAEVGMTEIYAVPGGQLYEKGKRFEVLEFRALGLCISFCVEGGWFLPAFAIKPTKRK
jgi:hypothetical protein